MCVVKSPISNNNPRADAPRRRKKSPSYRSRLAELEANAARIAKEREQLRQEQSRLGRGASSKNESPKKKKSNG